METIQAGGTHGLESTERQTHYDTEKSERARGTHKLESADGQTSQDIGRIRASEGYSPPGEHRRTDKVKSEMREESKQARSTHFLESTNG